MTAGRARVLCCTVGLNPPWPGGVTDVYGDNVYGCKRHEQIGTQMDATGRSCRYAGQPSGNVYRDHFFCERWFLPVNTAWLPDADARLSAVSADIRYRYVSSDRADNGAVAVPPVRPETTPG